MTKKKTKKTYVLDTNVLMHDPDALYAFDGSDVVIPMVVLEELDKHKSRQDGVGANARQVTRVLDGLRDVGSLFTGVKLHNGSHLYIKRIGDDAVSLLPREFSPEKNDHLILALVLYLQKEPGNMHVVLISKDINIRVKCDALGAHSEDYKKTRVVNSLDEMYTGVVVIEGADRYVADIFEDGRCDAKIVQDLYPNQIAVLKCVDGGQTVITKCIQNPETKQQFLIGINDIKSSFGLVPRNKEQGFSMDLLYDEDIKLVTLTGTAGTGKSLLACAAALDQLKTLGGSPRYDKFIVMRPIQSVGKEIGFLPGTVDEKMEPWIGPIRDCMAFLFGVQQRKKAKQQDGNGNGNGRLYTSDDSYMKIIQDKGLIEVEAITFMRGRSIPNAIMLIDESQNVNVHELKTLLTRAGEGTKIILTGDYFQIDNPYVDVYTNGLSYCIEKFKNQPIAGHISLIKGERSELATISSEIL